MIVFTELLLLLMLADAPDTAEDCGERVCVYANNSKSEAIDRDDAGSWKADAHLSRKRRRSEARKNRRRKDVELRVELQGARGSVFVDGRYLALDGPHAVRTLKPGRHELEVRDGDESIAVGVLTIPRRARALTVVVHADR